MVIRQKKFGTGKLVEMNYVEPYYYVELREVVDNWMPWEIRESDSTRPIMIEITKNINKAQEIYDEYTRKIIEERN